MRAASIDPRDQTLETRDPTFRVFFWTDDGSVCDEWEVSEADLDEVLGWIAENSHGRSHSLWVVTRTNGEVELVRLRGIDLDGTDPTAWPTRARQEHR